MDAGTSVLIFIGPIIGGFILYLIIHALVRTPGSMLQSRFASLGILQGKTGAEIQAKCGPPSAISASVNEQGQPIIIKQWQSTGYHIVLIFDQNDICLGVSHEVKV